MEIENRIAPYCASPLDMDKESMRNRPDIEAIETALQHIERCAHACSDWQALGKPLQILRTTESRLARLLFQLQHTQNDEQYALLERASAVCAASTQRDTAGEDSQELTGSGELTVEDSIEPSDEEMRLLQEFLGSDDPMACAVGTVREQLTVTRMRITRVTQPTQMTPEKLKMEIIEEEFQKSLAQLQTSLLRIQELLPAETRELSIILHSLDRNLTKFDTAFFERLHDILSVLLMECESLHGTKPSEPQAEECDQPPPQVTAAGATTSVHIAPQEPVKPSAPAHDPDAFDPNNSAQARQDYNRWLDSQCSGTDL